MPAPWENNSTNVTGTIDAGNVQISSYMGYVTNYLFGLLLVSSWAFALWEWYVFLLEKTNAWFSARAAENCTRMKRI